MQENKIAECLIYGSKKLMGTAFRTTNLTCFYPITYLQCRQGAPDKSVQISKVFNFLSVSPNVISDLGFLVSKANAFGQYLSCFWKQAARCLG
jgi:hypothetical protein